MNFRRIIVGVLLIAVFLLGLVNIIRVEAADDTPYFIVGDGSGGGGGGGGTGTNGAAGGGGDDTLDYSTHTATLVIFGDGSGGGGGGRGVGFTNNVVVGGAGGGGVDVITSGSGNDLIFGDGFNGGNTADGVFYPGNGGLGGGGAGAAGGGFGGPPGGGAAGICGGGGGGGTVTTGGGGGRYVACGNSTSGSNANGSANGGAGGNAASPETGSQGIGGAYSSIHGGGGGGFGGASGGSGATLPQAGNTNQYRVADTGSAIRNYFTESVLRTVLTNYPNYGAGADTINGKGGTNELFGLGGNDVFIVDSADNAVRNRIWDFSSGDLLVLKTNGAVIATVDVNSYVGGAVAGDYDGDGSSDDSKIVFEGINIDLVNLTSITVDDGGGIGTPNNSPTISLNNSPLAYTVGAGGFEVISDKNY